MLSSVDSIYYLTTLCLVDNIYQLFSIKMLSSVNDTNQFYKMLYIAF